MDPSRGVSHPGPGIERRHGTFALDEIGLPAFDPVLYGDGCFEGILVPGGRIFLLKEHIERFGIPPTTSRSRSRTRKPSWSS